MTLVVTVGRVLEKKNPHPGQIIFVQLTIFLGLQQMLMVLPKKKLGKSFVNGFALFVCNFQAYFAHYHLGTFIIILRGF